MWDFSGQPFGTGDDRWPLQSQWVDPYLHRWIIGRNSEEQRNRRLCTTLRWRLTPIASPTGKILSNIRAEWTALHLQDIKNALHDLSRQLAITLQWIPSHFEIPGKETVYALSKSSAFTGTYGTNKSLCISVLSKPSFFIPEDCFHFTKQKTTTTTKQNPKQNKTKSGNP